MSIAQDVVPAKGRLATELVAKLCSAYMKKSLRASYFLVPLTYIVVVFALILIQFRNSGTFDYDVGALQLSGILDQAGEGSTLSKLDLRLQGLRLQFDDQSQAKTTNGQGEVEPLALDGYQTIAGGFALSFEGGIRVEVRYEESDEEDSVTTLSVFAPTDSQDLQNISLPLVVEPQTEIEVNPNFPGLIYNWQGVTYTTLLPQQAFVDLSQSQMVLGPGAFGRDITIRPIATGNGNDLAWIIPNLSNLSSAEIEQLRSDYLNTAYEGWARTRYSPSTGTWANRDSGSEFSEAALVAYLAEAWRREDFIRPFADMREAAEANSSRLSYESSVFLGNLRTHTQPLVQENSTIGRQLLDLLENPSALYSRELLFHQIYDRVDPEVERRVITFLEQLDPSQLDIEGMTALLYNILIHPQARQELSSLEQRLSFEFTQKLLDNIVVSDFGLWIQREPGQGDSVTSLKAAYIIDQLNLVHDEIDLDRVSISLKESVYTIADDLGFIPQYLQITQGSVTNIQGWYPPEQLYGLIAWDNPWLPKHISFREEIQRGSWMYTIAQIDQINDNNSNLELLLSYPENRLHYFFITGVPPLNNFDGVQLFGQRWRNAPDFERYSLGRFYGADSGTLMVKYFFNESPKEVILWF